MKTITGSQQTALDSSIVNLAVFYRLLLTPTPLNLWSGIGSTTVSSITYTGTGDLTDVNDIIETVQSNAAIQTFSLSGIPTSLINTALDDDSYIGKTVSLSIGLYDTSGALIGSLIPIYLGFADTMTINIGQSTSAIVLSSVNGRILWERSNASRYTSTEQQRLYAGDLGLNYITTSINQPVNWKG